jgi:hypothetical protein
MMHINKAVTSDIIWLQGEENEIQMTHRHSWDLNPRASNFQQAHAQRNGSSSSLTPNHEN